MWNGLSNDMNRAYQLLGGYAQSSSKTESRPLTLKFADRIPSLSAMLERSGMSKQEIEKQIQHTIILSLILLALSIYKHNAIFTYLSIAVFIVQIVIFSSSSGKRREAFERDYTAMLLSLASSIRTGLDPLSALIGLKDLFTKDSEVRRELDKFCQNIEEGAEEEKAIRKFGATIDHPDVPLFQTAFILARKEGSSLSECLQRLARVTRQRQSFRRKVRSAVAMQKLSAFGIGLCAIAIGGIQFASNPTALSMTWAHPVGSKLLMLGLGLICIGIVWMLRMAKPKS